MKGYREMRQCNNCCKIYEQGKIPHICKKCGVRLLEDKETILYGRVTIRTDNCNVVIAKKTLFGWELKKGGENEG